MDNKFTFFTLLFFLIILQSVSIAGIDIIQETRYKKYDYSPYSNLVMPENTVKIVTDNNLHYSRRIRLDIIVYYNKDKVKTYSWKQKTINSLSGEIISSCVEIFIAETSKTIFFCKYGFGIKIKKVKKEK